VLLDHAHTLDEDLIFAPDDLQNFAFGSAVVAGDDTDDVALVDV
jgi:hypothetical protein